MRRLALASLIQAAMATAVLALLASILTRGSMTLPDDASPLVMLALLWLASGATAVLGFVARNNKQLRLPFALVCAVWLALYAMPVALSLWQEATAEPFTSPAEGTDPLITFIMVIGTAAERTGAAVVRKMMEIPMVMHGITLLLAASVCISDRHGTMRQKGR